MLKADDSPRQVGRRIVIRLELAAKVGRHVHFSTEPSNRAIVVGLRFMLKADDSPRQVGRRIVIRLELAAKVGRHVHFSTEPSNRAIVVDLRFMLKADDSPRQVGWRIVIRLELAAKVGRHVHFFDRTFQSRHCGRPAIYAQSGRQSASGGTADCHPP